MFSSNISSLRKLAELAQIEIKNEELGFFLKSFEELSKMILKFQKFEIGDEIDVMDSIITNHLTIDDLEDIQKYHVAFPLSKETIKKNALIDESKFVFMR